MNKALLGIVMIFVFVFTNCSGINPTAAEKTFSVQYSVLGSGTCTGIVYHDAAGAAVSIYNVPLPWYYSFSKTTPFTVSLYSCHSSNISLYINVDGSNKTASGSGCVDAGSWSITNDF